MTVIASATTPADQWRVRYYGKNPVRQIPDPTTGELLNYQRVSSFAKTLDDMGVLPQWVAWMALRGAEQAEGQVLKQRALHADKTPVGTIDELKALGGGDEARDEGQERHRILATALTGAPVPTMHPDARAELDAVLRLVESLGQVRAVEAPNVCDEWRTAGTLDLVLEAPDGATVVADFKTGKMANVLATSIQLITYARSHYWDFNTESRVGLVAPTRPRLILIHAPQTTPGAPPQAVELDVERAKRWANLAWLVKTARKEAKAA
jgi:hypothetical protein